MVARTFSKPQDARRVEARARARTLGVRVEVVSEARYYRTRSQSQPGEVYQLVRTRDGWCCSCQGFEFTGCCKHLGQVERRAEREGWAFGAICPLGKAAQHFPLEPVARGGQDDAPTVVAVPTADSQSGRAARTRAALSDLYGDAA